MVGSPSSPSKSGSWEDETYGASDPHLGVRGGCTVAVRPCLSECTRDSKLVVSRSRDLFSFGVVRVVSRWGRGGGGMGRVGVDPGCVRGRTTRGVVGTGP